MPDAENLPRISSNAALLRAVSSAMDRWSSELYRRRNDTEDNCPVVNLQPFPETLDEWQRQRSEILSFFKDNIYGEIPPPPHKITVRLLSEKLDALENTAVRRELRIYCSMSDGRTHDFDMLLYMPKKQHKVPVFVGLNFDGNQSCSDEINIRITRAPAMQPGSWWRYAETSENTRGTRADRWNIRESVARGYAVATACYGEIFPDNPDGFSQSIYTLFKSPDALMGFPALPAEKREFGAISAWAWGLSRMMDVLETNPEIDSQHAAVVGHSRLGKAAIWAGVNDERFSLVISNNSGCLGAAPSCRKFGEQLGHLAYIQNFWFSDRVLEYAFREDALPFDQHQLLALIAPRNLYVASSSEDNGADPYGEFLSAQAAAKVWALYGKNADMPEEMPPVGQGCGKSVRYHIKQGNHSITPEDWQYYYNAAECFWQK